MTETIIQVRASTVDDSPALSAAARSGGVDACSGSRVLVVDIAGEPAGYAMLGPARSCVGRAGKIYELYLRPDCQGIGLGRRLFDASR